MTAEVPALYQQTLARLAHDHPLIGAALLRHRNVRKAPISFKTRPYLVEMYDDLHVDSGVEMDIVKAPQTGQTEIGIQMALHEAGWLGRIVGYVLPTQELRNRFVANRINPLLTEVAAYRRKLPGAEAEELRSGQTGNLRSKQLGSGRILFLGAKTSGDFVEFSADTMWIDEYDLCLQASELNMALAKDRIREGHKPRMHRLGNPEIPRGGIEELWEKGDQRLYHWRCEHCGERQPIDWLNGVVRQDDTGRWRLRDTRAETDGSLPVRVECRRCHQLFTREGDGACWVPNVIEKGRRRSYRVKRFDVLSQDLREAFAEWVIAQGSSTLLRAWWRAWDGIAWEPSSGELVRTDLVDGAVCEGMDWSGGQQYHRQSMISGLDVGGLLNITITKAVRGASGKIERRGVWIGTVVSKDQVLDLYRRYHVRTACMDEGPEYRLAQDLRDEAKKQGTDLWLCHFSPQPRIGREAFAAQCDFKARKVTVDRTQLMDTTADEVRLGAAVGRLYKKLGLLPPPDPSRGEASEREAATTKLKEVELGGESGSQLTIRLWPEDVMDVMGFEAQMCAPKRLTTPEGKIEWSKTGKPDHYRLADSYERMAWHLDQRGGSFF